MNIKQIFIFFCLFIVFISALSFVSAADDVSDSIVSIPIDNTQIAQATDTQDSVLAADSGSFTQLDDEIQNTPVNKSIKLHNNYTYSSGERVGTDGIVINKDITIDGDGHAIDGDNLASIFQITDNANVVLKNIVFCNARGNNGSAISLSSSENVEIINCQFINNSALNGGAIYVASADTSYISSNFNIVGSTFINNRAINGGAVYVSGTLKYISSSIFKHNFAINDGGSIYSDLGGRIDGNIFEHETAGHDGGAIYLNSIIDSSLVDPSILEDLGLFNNRMAYCSAGNDGGAGFFNATHGAIRNLTVNSNVANRNGGAIVWLCSNSSIVDTTVFNNTATYGDGGGIYLYPPKLSSVYDAAVVMMYSNFTYNTAGNSGGALYCGGLFSVILNSTFAHDNAYDGAGIYLDVGAAINHCIFDGENAINDGGAIYLNASNTIISGFSPYMQLIIDNVGVRHSVISNCIAGHDGGAGYVFGNRGVVENLTMINNTAGHDGGAGYVVGNYGQLFDSLFINNTAANDGGALLWEGVNGTINNITVVNNKATNNGGGIALDAASSQGTTSISNSSFKANTADYGGAIYCANMFTNILDSNFAHDKAYYGGGIYLDYGAYIHNSTLFNESAVYDGGGIYLNSSNTKLDSSILQQLLLDNKVGVIDSFILNCTAGRDGGAGYVYGDYGIVNNLTMINNFAGRGGGAGYVYGDYGRLYNSTMINNRAGDDGGALFWQGNGGTVFNLTCKVNYAGDAGGSIFIFGSDLSFTDSSFTLSNASDYGGAIYIYGDNVLINNSLFEKCAVNAYDGGAVYASGSNTTISKCNFIMNRVNIMNGGRGGSINLQGNGAKILDCIFERCTAYEGGVVYINGTNAVLDNLSCIYSFATNGGAFYLNGNNATIFNTKVSFNNATDYGGAIYVAGDFALIDNSNFTKCIVYQYDGGAIYAEGLNATILNSCFGENKVIGNKARGGSMFIQGDYLSLEGCTFNRCTAYEGGVIYINGSNARIEDSSNTFSLAQSGSAIYVAGNNVTICHFNSSYANSTLKGGSIYIEGNDSNIFNSNFLRVHSLLGGAIYISGDNAIVNESTFNYCMGNGTYEGGVGGAGGSIYVEGEDATISGSQFKFSSAANYGGAIYVDGANVNIYGTSYDTCSANAYNGGAIYVKGLNATIFDSNFTRNRVNVSNFARGGSIDVYGDNSKISGCIFEMCLAYDGGIIYVNGNNAIIDNSTLTYSSAVNDGGAIYIAGSDATISNSTLNFNNATSYGGAIYVDGANAHLDGNVFANCSSDKYNGGAVYVKGLNTTISNSGFTRNKVNVSNFARGGSIYIAGSNTEIFNSTFDFCMAYEGAVIYIDGADAHIDGSLFTHSSAVNNGGAIYVKGLNATISNSTLNFNNATNYGGAIYVDGANAHIDRDIFEKCSADMLNGGAVFINGLNATISNSDFSMNRVNVATFARGGSIYIAGDDSKVFNTTFELCRAYVGGVLYLEGDNGIIDGSTFRQSSALFNGGAVYVAGNNATISNSLLNYNNATQYGGSIYVAGNNSKIDGSTFLRCSVVTMNGGAIYISGLNTTISNSNFTQNSANGTNARGGSIDVEGNGTKILGSVFDMCIAYEGGVVYINGTGAIIDNSTFTRSTARINGGSVYVAGDNAIISNSRMRFNNAKDYGGSLYIKGDNAKIIGDNFDKCSANNYYGGAIYISGLNTTVADSNFTQNSANGTNARGGSIDISGNDTKILRSNFYQCIAFEGGVIYINGENAVIDNSIFTQSHARINGGAIYVNGENASISNSILNLNNATDYGGAIYVAGDNAVITSNLFDKCSAVNKDGGAIYVAGLNTTISYSNFTMNSANGTGAHGGAIDINGNDTSIYKCIFERCSAYDGGTLYIYGEGTVIDGMDFKYSSALHDGGIIYILGNDVTISNTNFSYSNASHNGGAVYVAGNNSNIVNSSFTVCIAKNGGDGGAIYIAGLNATVEASRFNITQSAQGKGGAIFIAGDNATVVDSTLIRANSTSGGFMYIEGDNVKVLNSSMMFSSSNIVPNATGLGRGGAIFIAGDNAVISADFKFTNATGGNGFDGDGGALYVEGNNVTVVNSTFFTTIAKNGGDGGAIYIAGLDATVKDSYFEISQSALGRGGAIYVNGYNANVLNSTFIRANSTAGGFIYIEGARADVLDSTFMFSSSNIIKNGIGDGNGGAIYIAGDDAVVSGDFRFINATGGEGIPGHGGAIYVAGNNANITDSTFFGTHARNDGFGGAIYVTGNNTYMNNDTFDNGFAYNAGAVYISGNNAVINMSEFVSNNCMDDGGAVYITGENVKVINSNFTSNIAGDDGGAIYWEGNGGLMENITCFDNHAISSTGSSNGGTICIIGSNINLNASTFEQTHALIAGGAIFITGNYVNITDSSFKNCFVSMDIEDTGKEYANGGGSIYVLGNYSNLLNCIFEDTHAREGGAIYIQGNEVTIDELNSTSTYAKAGGSIYIAGENAKLLNSNLTYSHANDGGAIYVRGDNTLIDSSLFAYNNVSLSADSLGSGGAIYVRGASTNITHSTFLYSTAYGGDGGSVYIGGYNTNIEYSEFQHSRANEGEGGSIFVAGNLAHVHDSLFNDTQAGDGGAIYIGGFRTGEDAKILNCTITNSQSKDDGGAIYVAGANALISVDISNSKSLGLKDTTGYGGAIYVGGDDANITQSSFNNCSAGTNAEGGAIYVEGDYANIEKSKFHNTYANDGELASGGAIAIEGNRAIVSESEFTECFASNGGVLFVEGRRAELRDSNITDCYAYGYGGAIYILDGEKTLIDGSLFDNCTSINKEGGAIVINGDFTIISNSNFTNCNASSTEGLGGAIYIEGEETTIQNAIFTECISVDGGAIYIQGNDVHISDSAFIANKLKDYADDDNYGGAIYINGERTIISTSTFEDHSAYTGGSIYINGKDTTILDSNITRSTADYGGAVFIQGINAKIEGGNISYCSCAYDGGAIYVNGTNAHISADFAYCNASSVDTPNIKGNGGAIYVNGTDTNVYDSTFLNCTAMNDGYGGAIYIEGLNTLVQNSKFENTWTSDNGLGGAIYVEGSNATVDTSEFNNCHAREGGAIYIEGINTTVTDSKFTNTNVGKACEWNGATYGNTGGYISPIVGDGGAIYIYGANTHIENATISSSYATKQGGAIYVEGDNAIISATIYDSSSGLTQSVSKGFNVNAITNDVNIIKNNLNSMIAFYYMNIGLYSTNISSIKINANNAKDKSRVDNIFSNGVFNLANFNVVWDYVMQINSTLSSLESSSSLIYDSLIGYYNNIYNDLIEINATRNYAAFNGHIKNNIKGNLTSIVAFVDYCNDLNTNLQKSNEIANKLQAKNDYYDVNNKLENLQGYCAKINKDINDLIQYNSDFNYLLQYNEAFGTQVNKIHEGINALHDEGIRGEGGAIYVAGHNTLVHDSFIYNTHADNNGDGGAVYVAGVNTVVRDSNFDKSYAYDGGAVYVTGTNTSIIDSNFTNMEATHVGGAVYVAGHNTYITGDSFYNSKSKGTGNHDGGGAMYIVGDGTYVSDSNFTLSDSKRYGGAIYIAGKNTDIVKSNFIQNHASSPGGAVYIQEGLGLNTTIDYCYFFDNSAGNSAGALHVSGTNTTVNNTVFIKNHGVSQGGAIYIDGINATVQYSNLTENSASTHGGAIYWKGGHGGDSIVGCIIFNNSATSYDGALGGGVYWDIGNRVTPGGLVKDTIFDSNYAGKHGGGMDWHRSVNSTMDNCTFINNIAGKDGGGFYCGDTAQFDVSTNLTIINTKFINNTANYAGGGLSLQMRDSHLINCTFENNIAYFGGSIVIKDTKTTNNQIINCTFINSTASTVLINSTVQAIVDHYGALEEFCKGKGGAIFTRDNLVSVIGCTFINCTGKEGGAVFWDGGDNYQKDNPSRRTGSMGDNGIIRNSTFIGNNATLGGAICWTSPNGVVTDSIFIGNNATLGGAVYWKGGVEYIAYAWNYKDTFAIHGNNGKVLNSEFIDNTATNGGAIYWAGENGNVSNSKFTNNYAEKGGAIYWTTVSETATYNDGKSTIYTKTATTGNNGIVEDSKFFANKANYETGLGGALYWNTSSSNITDTIFLNNTASKGGALYWVNGTKIDNSTFRFNKAHTGSAIYEDASMKEMDIIDSSFLENRADSNKFEQFNVTGTNTGIKVSAYFRGNDNIINAMYNDGGEVYFTNVTYLGVNALAVNTGLQRKTPVKIDTIPSDSDKFYQSDYEVGQIVRISVYDQNGLVAEDIALTGFNGYVEREYGGLTAGDAKVKIEHPADDYYTYLGDRNGAQLVFIFIDTNDIYCLDDEIINITVVPQNKSETRAPTGFITIKVTGNNGKTYESDIILTVVEGTNSSIAQFNATLCPTGIYSVDVYYHGDAENYFFPQDNSSSFRVFEIDPTIVIQTENIWVGQTEVINITVDPTKKVTGTVSVYIDSVYIGDLPLVNGTIQIRNSTLPVGVHNVIGIYNGDEHFKLVRNTSTFVVSKYDPYFVIEGRTIFVDDQEYLEIFISNKTESGLVHIPTGFVYLVVDGQQYYINLTTQKGILLPISTEADIYHVWGNYSGDGFWNSAVNTTDFLVLKHNITLNVTDVVKVYGGEEKINVTFEYDDVTGNVTIRIMDKTQTLLEFKDVPIVKGNATVEVSGLNPGNYTIDVVYLGDRKYYGNTTSGNLTVKKGTIPIIIVPHNIFFGQKEIINVYSNTTGWVDIYINGTKIGDDYFANGEAESSKSELAPGIYNASAYFRGNEYYEPGWVSAPFEVYKLNRTVDLIVYDIIYGDIEYLQVLVNASGNVTIWVNGSNTTVVLEVEQFGTIDKGKAKLNLEGLDVGTYPVEVWYNGNEFYNPAYTWGVFQVVPVNTTLTVDAHNIYVWDNESLSVTVRDARGSIIKDAPGNITISIDGVIYSEKLNNGVARFVIPNLTIGTKNVWAFYDGDKNHNGNRSLASFKVMPRGPVVNVTAQNITVGKVENLHVEIPANATGFVIITGNFTENGIYVSKFVGGKADISVHDLASGTYSVHIKYYGGGDDNYTIAEADTVFKVSGEDTPIHIDVKDICYRQTANITVSVNDGVTGLITIKVVNGSGIIREITLPISKGKVNLLVDNLAVDTYTVYADYLGNNKYHANSTSKVFKVKKIAPQITIDSVDTNSIRNATVVVHITPGTTGNVTITVNNKKYNGTIENGVVKIVIDQLNSGNYTVHAYYAGDRNFTEASATKVNSVNIFRYSCYLMNVTAEDTKVDLNTTIIVNLPYDATGFVNITVNETLYPNVKVERGVAKLNVTKSIYGKYIVKATFMDGKYANKTVTTNYHVFKWETPMVITVINETSLHVGDIVTIVVGVPANITDNVTIEIAGNKYSSKVINGNATFKVANLTSGNKTVTAIYAGNYKYMFNATTHSFKIAKRPSTVVVNTTGINVGDVAIINVTVPANATGYVVISVNGTNYTVNVTDGKGSIPVSGLPYGTYNINVTYIGDEQYLPSTNSTTLKVSKVPSFITVAVNNITVGDVAIINMTVPKDATGNITVKVNSTVVVVGIVNGIVQAIIPYLKVGNYTVDVTYNGDGKYLSSTNATKLTVNKVSSEIIVVDYGNGTVVVIVPGNATGNVTIEVEGKNFTGPVINGTAVINLTNVTPGEHNITVIYSGDENHTSEIINATVAINKIISPIKVVVTDIYVGDVAKINVTVPGNATGKIRIEIDGKAYFEPIDDGVARFKVENLTAGVKTVAVSYAGDGNYTANFTTANFTVKKHAPVITVNAADITVGGIVLINVTAPSDVTRPVIVNVNDVDYAVNITKGVGQLSVADLGGGKYNVTVKYLGDDKYLAANNTAEFKVSKVPATVSTKADNITVGEKAVIEITVPRDATGNVTVRVDNKDYNVSVADGKGTLVVPGLKVGNYTVDVKYLGDRKYESNVNATIFSVNKASSEIIVVNQGNGTVVVVVPDNATGNVTIEVEGKNFTGPVINGTAVINLTNVTPGEHNITVIYSGDENHTSEIINATVAINKIIAPIKVVVTDIYVGDVAKINVTVSHNATGKIRIEIDGKAYFEPIDDGVARFKVENLTGGVKTVYVSYGGDNNYAGNHISGNFTVKKHTPSVTVNAGDITVGEIVLINVTAPSDVTRPVIVNVGGVDYAVNITNGIGQLPVSNLDGGSYGVTVKYLGDDKYLDADNATGFKVSKLPSSVSVKADNITVGEKAIIEITVLDDATGIVVVNVNGKDYNVPVADGKGTLVVSGLKVGNYTVNVKYIGDRKYEESTNSCKFAVNKIVTDEIIVVDQGNGTVVVVVPGNATGNVTIEVEGKNFTGPVINGTAIINLTNMTSGEHNITVIYSGDENHTSKIINSTVTIREIVPAFIPIVLISVDVNDIYVGDVARINVTVIGNATGKVRLEIDGKEYFADIENGVAMFEVENLTAGVKTVAVIYLGDENYAANFTTANFTVYKRASTVSGEIESIVVGEYVTVKVKVPIDATGQVLIDIDGVSQYYVNVTGGKGLINIPYIPSGEYNVNLTYIGDAKYLPSTNIALFDVNKVKPFVIPIAHDIYVGELESIRLFVPADATGNVTVIIDGEVFVFDLNKGTLGAYYHDGEKYIVAISGGNGELVIAGLPVGEYVVSVRYNGDYRYTTAENSTVFNVISRHTDMEIIDQGNGTVVVIVPDNATGNVTIVVENKTFVAPVINGTAVIDLINVTPGKHNITAIYSGDETHDSSSKNATVDIPKYYAPISVKTHDIYVGDTEIVVVTVPRDATGIITIEINAKEYSAPIKDGQAVFNVDGLAFGNKTVAVKYSGDDKYRDNYTTGQFKVIKLPTTTTATAHDIHVGENETIVANVLPGDATGIVLVNMGGVGYYAAIVNGTADIIIPELPNGVYVANVYYNGDGKYLPSNTTVKFTVSKLKAPIDAAGDEIKEGNDATVVVRVPKDATGTVTITVDGKTYTEKVKDGKAVFVIPGLVKGDWNVDASYSGDKKYEANDTITDILVYRPDIRDNSTENNTDNEPASQVRDGINLSDYPTGNPILIIFLILIALGVSRVRRFKK